MLRVLEERGLPGHRAAAAGVGAQRGARDRLPRPAAHRADPDRRRLRGHPDRPLLGRQRAREGVRARGRRGRGRRHRQLERLPHGPRRCPSSCPRSTRTTSRATAASSPTPTASPRRWWWRSSRSPTRSAWSGVIVSSYQSVSGTGQAAVRELTEQSAGYLAGDEPEPSVYPHPIAFNVLPHIDAFDESGYTGEERKVADETRKMLGLPGPRRQRDLRARAGDAVALAGGPHRDHRGHRPRRGPPAADGRPRRGAGGRARR